MKVKNLINTFALICTYERRVGKYKAKTQASTKNKKNHSCLEKLIFSENIDSVINFRT